MTDLTSTSRPKARSRADIEALAQLVSSGVLRRAEAQGMLPLAGLTLAQFDQVIQFKTDHKTRDRSEKAKKPEQRPRRHRIVSTDSGRFVL